MVRGFYIVITQDRTSDLIKFLTHLLKYNRYPVHIIVADNKLDAHRKKTEIGLLSPFDATVYLDTDILVNGNLDFLFEQAESGYFAIYRETTAPLFNSGVFTLPKHVKEWLSNEWRAGYDKKKNKITGCFDQDILNNLLPKLPCVPLPRAYNCILKEITPEQELELWDSVKIFHFLHQPGFNYSPYKSYKIYHET